MLVEFLLLGLAAVAITGPEQSSAFTPQVAVTDEELAALGETLWSLDKNNIYNLTKINVQGATNSQGVDNAPLPLLSVQPQAYQKPTIAKLIALQDNYIPDVGKNEVVTSQETLEESQFLDAVLATDVMKKAEEFLTQKGYVGDKRTSPRTNPTPKTNNNAFRDALREIWFGMYSRQNPILGSSGFEHVFVAEIKNGEISGFHNSIYFARQEANNLLNYNGHKRVLRLGSKGMVLKYTLNWNKNTKPVTSMFIGPSPEFEMALYTVCFYTRPGARCPITLGGKSVPIRTYYMTKLGKRYVSSAYPDI